MARRRRCSRRRRLRCRVRLNRRKYAKNPTWMGRSMGANTEGQIPLPVPGSSTHVHVAGSGLKWRKSIKRARMRRFCFLPLLLLHTAAAGRTSSFRCPELPSLALCHLFGLQLNLPVYVSFAPPPFTSWMLFFPFVLTDTGIHVGT